MDPLNQYAISRMLGTKMKPVKAARFGNFALLETTAEALRAREMKGPANSTAHFTYTKDKVVVQAFEAVRNGVAPDAILWDTALADTFYDSAKRLGLDAPAAFLGRRLINVRKNARRYAKHGIEIAPATVSPPHTSILQQHAHVIEFALVRLRFRYGASIDDILLDPELGRKFEELAHSVAPSLPSQDLRLGALTLRKSRFLEKKRLNELVSLNPGELEAACSAPISLSDMRASDIPAKPGLIELTEGSRFLYIARSENLRPTVTQFHTGKAFSIMANQFWEPSLDEIKLRFLVGARWHGVGMGTWERKLIYDHEPVFNWPMQKKAA